MQFQIAVLTLQTQTGKTGFFDDSNGFSLLFYTHDMIQTVLKRDGRVVGYNEEKIKAAIRKAMLATEAGEDEGLIQRIADRIGQRGRSQMSVEDIQDQVELELMKSPRKEVARCYINYRQARSVAQCQE